MSERTRLISPCGGTLIDLVVSREEREDLKARAAGLPSVQISERAVCDLEVLATGGFAPLDRFMGRADYERVLGEMRLASGQVFPIPVTLPADAGPGIRLDAEVALRTVKSEILAVMRLDEIYEWSLEQEARQVLGTVDPRHPLVAEMHGWGRVNLSGPVRLVNLPYHYDSRDLRLTPAETRARLECLGRPTVVAFQPRHPLHRAYEELTKRAADSVAGVLLLHPAVGLTRPGDVDHHMRIRTYRTLVSRYYEPDRILLALLPLATRLAGPREALWHALIWRNHGASHMLLDRDHASPGLDSQGKPFCGPCDAQDLVAQYQGELGVGVIPFREFAYLPDEERYEEISRVRVGTPTASLSGTSAREDYLDRGRLLPAWFTRREVAEILADTYPPRHRQGVCVWFTGLSGAGKSTTAEVLTVLLIERGRQVTLLDGDVVRTHLSKGLGFSKEDRDTNILRIGFVAAEIVRHGGAVVCAAVSPYRATRAQVRSIVGSDHFVEVFVDTPLEVCEGRDLKGMYARARRGEIRGFTGVDDPYEPPESPEIRLDTLARTAEENARSIIDLLIRMGFVRPAEASSAANEEPRA